MARVNNCRDTRGEFYDLRNVHLILGDSWSVENKCGFNRLVSGMALGDAMFFFYIHCNDSPTRLRFIS